MGITLADVETGADSNSDLATSAGHKIVMEEIPLPWVMRQLMEDGQWYWSHLTGQVSFLGGLLEMIRKRSMEDYMENRVRTQTDPTNLYEWKAVNTGWTSKVWSFSMLSFAGVGLLQRLIFDWHLDGRNAAKSLTCTVLTSTADIAVVPVEHTTTGN